MQKQSWLQTWSGFVAGRRSKWVTLLVWIVLTGVLSAVWPNVSSQENNAARQLPGDAWSLAASELQQRQFPSSEGVPALIVWYRADGLGDADLAGVQKVAARLAAKPLPAQTGVPPYERMPLPALRAALSQDGSMLVMPVTFADGTETEVLQSSIDKLQELATAELGANPFAAGDVAAAGLHARVTGPVGIQTDATALFKDADLALLLATVLLVLVLLIVLYRSPILALVPLVGVGFAYGVISPMLGFCARAGWIVVDGQSISIMTVLLFGAGTDYCLFFVARYRQALLEEADKHRALQAALSGSAGAIGMSGLTVIVSLLGLLFARYGSNHSFAVPFSVAILIMALASLTLVPALLAIIGRKSFFPFVPLTPELRAAREAATGKRLRPQQAVGRAGALLGRLVTERPRSVLAVSLLVLLALSAFAPQIKFTYNLLESFPADMPSREGFALLAQHTSPGALAPLKAIVDINGASGEADVRGALQRLPYVATVSEPQSSSVDANLQKYEVVFKDDPYNLEAIERIPEIRAMLQETLSAAGIAAPKLWVGGETATQYDMKTVVERDTRIVIPVVIAVIALLLLVYLRSIVATIYLIVTVLLSYFSALGAGWLILHHGMGIDAIQGLIPLYAFVFLVALGEDYNIFMVSSIWQERRNRSQRDAIRLGVSQTSSVITSAGLILAGTFAVLATLPIQVLVQFGTICAVGVLLDTFVVRPFLVPSITLLLGRWAFWPGRLYAVKDEPAGPASAKAAE